MNSQSTAQIKLGQLSSSATAAAAFGRALAPRVVASRYSARDLVVRRLLMLGDALALALALVGIFLANGPVAWTQLGWAALTIPVWLAIFRAYGLYDRDIERISKGMVDQLPSILNALLLGGVLLWLCDQLTPGDPVSFLQVVVFGALAFVLILAARMVAHRAIQGKLSPERALLVGDDRSTATFARKLRRHPEFGVKPVGMVATSSESHAPSQNGALSLRRLGCLDDDQFDLGTVAAGLGIERVVILNGDTEEDALADVLLQAQQHGIKIGVVPRPTAAVGPSVEVDQIEDVTVLCVRPSILSRSSRVIKRAMDLAGSLMILLACAPVIGAIALAVKLDSPGPALFRQRRVGQGGRLFSVVKFRTMVTGADRMVDALLAESQDPSWLLLDNDPRVTRVGRILRRTSLDELPQAWNILKGEMSLVGPRPLVEAEQGRVSGLGRRRTDLAPGLTGPWQVLGRTNIPFAEMIELDYLYVTNWSLWGDVKLLLSTVPVVLSRQGAN